MRRLFAVSLVVGGLLLSACGGATLTAHRGATVMSVPLIATPGPIPPTTAVWTPVVAAQTQAAQLEVAEELYATCFAYAGLNRSLAGAPSPVTAPVTPSCSTNGLTPAEAEQIQNLVIEAS